MKNRVVATLLCLCMAFCMLPTAAFAAGESDPTVEAAEKRIFGNGTALIIQADGAGTTVYIDSNRNGRLDPGEQSLAQAAIAGAPANGADLSEYSVFGGGSTAAYDSTMLTMLSGTVAGIYGGGYDGDITGDTSVTLKGGTVGHVLNATTVLGGVYGGGYNGDVGGNTSVSIGGGTVNSYGNDGSSTVLGGVYGGGYDGNVNGNTSVTISGDIAAPIFGGGCTAGATVGGNASITVNSGTMSKALFGGGNKGKVNGNASVSITGGAVTQGFFGGGYANGSTVGGNTNVTISGGTVSGGFGGGYRAAVTGDAGVSITDGTVTGSVFGGGSGWSASAPVGGNTSVSISGGSVGNLYGAGEFGAPVGGNASVSITGGTVTGNVNGAGAWVDVAGNVSITISDGSVGGDVFGAGTRAGTVHGDASIIISGGTVAGNVSGGGTSSSIAVSGTKTVSVSGNAKVGTAAATPKGIQLSSLTGEKAIISGPLTGNPGEIVLIPGAATPDGTVVASATTPANANASKFTLVNIPAGRALVADRGNGNVYCDEPVSFAKHLIETATWTVPQGTANTEADVKAWVGRRLAAMGLPAGVTPTVTMTRFTAAVEGTNGSFGFTAELVHTDPTNFPSQTAAVTNGIVTASAPVPKTGDGSMPWLWAGLIVLAGCGLFALRRRRKA